MRNEGHQDRYDNKDGGVGNITDKSDNSDVRTKSLTVSAAVWSWWKNNSFTKAAQAADDVKSAIKSGAVSADEVEASVNK